MAYCAAYIKCTRTEFSAAGEVLGRHVRRLGALMLLAHRRRADAVAVRRGARSRHRRPVSGGVAIRHQWRDRERRSLLGHRRRHRRHGNGFFSLCSRLHLSTVRCFDASSLLYAVWSCSDSLYIRKRCYPISILLRPTTSMVVRICVHSVLPYFAEVSPVWPEDKCRRNSRPPAIYRGAEDKVAARACRWWYFTGTCRHLGVDWWRRTAEAVQLWPRSATPPATTMFKSSSGEKWNSGPRHWLRHHGAGVFDFGAYGHVRTPVHCRLCACALDCVIKLS